MEDGSCPVCYQHHELITKWTCSHEVCEECINKLYKCPICRSTNTNTTYMYLNWDIDIIMRQTNVTRSVAVYYFKEYNFDIVDTIMYLATIG